MSEPRTTAPDRPKTLETILNRIIDMSVDDYYNPYKTFDWPETLPEEQWWMSPELMTVHGTQIAEQLPEATLMRLSKWESIHFYSLNVHGIRELLLEVVRRVHTPGFDGIQSEFFHHFIGEENEHMWFFATFCLKYGQKIYPDKKLALVIGDHDADVESFLVFSRILIFEEIVDYFNYRIGRDERLHPIIRQVNSIHHQDESRHIAFGRETVKHLWGKLCETHTQDQLDQVRGYLERYIQASVESLYNPAAYRDAGVPDPYQVRRELLADPVRHEANRKYLKRTIDFYVNSGILTRGDFLHATAH